MPKTAIYTLGYAGRTLEEVAALVNAHQGVLVDVRYKPSSRLPGFHKASLTKRLGDRYVHCPSLGNLHYKGGPIALADYPRGLEEMRALVTNTPTLLLLCVCRNVQFCHRATVAEALSDDLGVPHAHL